MFSNRFYTKLLQNRLFSILFFHFISIFRYFYRFDVSHPPTSSHVPQILFSSVDNCQIAESTQYNRWFRLTRLNWMLRFTLFILTFHFWFPPTPLSSLLSPILSPNGLLVISWKLLYVPSSSQSSDLFSNLSSNFVFRLLSQLVASHWKRLQLTFMFVLPYGPPLITSHRFTAHIFLHLFVKTLPSVTLPFTIAFILLVSDNIHFKNDHKLNDKTDCLSGPSFRHKNAIVQNPRAMSHSEDRTTKSFPVSLLCRIHPEGNARLNPKMSLLFRSASHIKSTYERSLNDVIPEKS